MRAFHAPAAPLEPYLEVEMTLVNLSRRAAARLPAGAYDVLGWEVRTEIDDEKRGKVDDTLVDENDRPRYLEVSLGILRRNVRVPLSVALADPSMQIVCIEKLDKDMLSELSASTGDAT